jgi:hypothetical protein
MRKFSILVVNATIRSKVSLYPVLVMLLKNKFMSGTYSQIYIQVVMAVIFMFLLV